MKVIGVSADSVASQAKFIDKNGFEFLLLADKQKAVIKAFGVPTNPLGMASRQAFLLKNGKILWKTEKASPTGMVDEVLGVLKAQD